jgi:hypothetical protein
MMTTMASVTITFLAQEIREAKQNNQNNHSSNFSSTSSTKAGFTVLDTARSLATFFAAEGLFL